MLKGQLFYSTLARDAVHFPACSSGDIHSSSLLAPNYHYIQYALSTLSFMLLFLVS